MYTVWHVAMHVLRRNKLSFHKCMQTLGTLKLSSCVVQVARYLGVVDRHAHDANSKHRILSICRMYLAKRITDMQGSLKIFSTI